MTEHPNVEIARRGYEAFAKGDMATLTELIADDVVWHVQGVGPLDGDYHGRDQVFGFFGRLAEETGGTFRLDVHDILANDEHTAVLCNLSATRGNKSIATPVVNVSHNCDGRITEFWAATTDPQAALTTARDSRHDSAFSPGSERSSRHRPIWLDTTSPCPRAPTLSWACALVARSAAM